MKDWEIEVVRGGKPAYWGEERYEKDQLKIFFEYSAQYWTTHAFEETT